MNAPALEQPYCSELSIQAGEPLYASATPTTLYLLLEYEGAWGTKALDESDLPQAVKSRLNAFVKASPLAKLLLLRSGISLSSTTGQTPSTTTGQAPLSSTGQAPPSSTGQAHIAPGITFYVALAGESESRLYKLSLDDYQELLDVDLEGLASGSAEFEPFRSSERLALVCTNGRRDRCCARFGMAVYNALSQAIQAHTGVTVWQATHMGGHRFAANLLWLPEGVLYGRVDPQSAASILNAQMQGQVYLPNLRGRAVYPEIVQAADFMLRQRSGETALEAFHWLETREVSQGRWQVRFIAPSDGSQHTVELSSETMETAVFESCALDKTTFITRYLRAD